MADDLSLYWSLFQGEFPGESIEKENATRMGHCMGKRNNPLTTVR